jgi:hypothetical protein
MLFLLHEFLNFRELFGCQFASLEKAEYQAVGRAVEETVEYIADGLGDRFLAA